MVKKIFLVILIVFANNVFADVYENTKIFELVLENISTTLGTRISDYSIFEYEYFDTNLNCEIYKLKKYSEQIHYCIQNNNVFGVDVYIREKSKNEIQQEIKLVRNILNKKGFVLKETIKQEEFNVFYYKRGSISASIILYYDDPKFFRLFFGKMID